MGVLTAVGATSGTSAVRDFRGHTMVLSGAAGALAGVVGGRGAGLALMVPTGHGGRWDAGLVDAAEVTGWTMSADTKVLAWQGLTDLAPDGGEGPIAAGIFVHA